MASRDSQIKKREELLKLGITNSDISQLFFAQRAAAKQARRAAQLEAQATQAQAEADRLRQQQEAAQAQAEAQLQIIAKYTFGVEIECYNADRNQLISTVTAKGLAMYSENYNHSTRRYYKLVHDASIMGYNGVECVTPVLNGNAGFDSLHACCDALNECGARVNKSTGLHVHIGGQITTQQYINTFVNYCYLEPVIDSFMAPSRRGNNNVYAKTLHYKIADILSATSIYEIYVALDHNRYHKLNPCSWARHHTIEFRQHQGTTDYEKISNWARFCIKLVDYSATHRLTSPPATIDDIEFLTEQEKNYFKQRAATLAIVAAFA